MGCNLGSPVSGQRAQLTYQVISRGVHHHLAGNEPAPDLRQERFHLLPSPRQGDLDDGAEAKVDRVQELCMGVRGIDDSP